MIGLRLTDGLDMGVHPQDVIDHAGTPLGDELMMLQLNANVGLAFAHLYGEINKSWWRVLLDMVLRR
ncbi:hypothetical protein LCGC14_1338600 [marine sediment metagenome]|uniref:Uncharacterized protein n=1 Tax=marine sediment metagenome TaxID=412755 RepID=A0A0F9KF19_9ZZZZ